MNKKLFRSNHCLISYALLSWLHRWFLPHVVYVSQIHISQSTQFTRPCTVAARQVGRICTPTACSDQSVGTNITWWWCHVTRALKWTIKVAGSGQHVRNKINDLVHNWTIGIYNAAYTHLLFLYSSTSHNWYNWIKIIQICLETRGLTVF